MATKYVADEEVETASEDEAPSRPAGKRKVKARAKPTVKAKPASKHAKGNGRAVSTKPRAKRQRDPAGLDSFGLRLKSIKSRAAAMYARKAGATLAQVKDEVGSVQFNVIKELEDKGFKFKRVTEDSGTHGRKATRYFLQHK